VPTALVALPKVTASEPPAIEPEDRANAKSGRPPEGHVDVEKLPPPPLPCIPPPPPFAYVNPVTQADSSPTEEVDPSTILEAVEIVKAPAPTAKAPSTSVQPKPHGRSALLVFFITLAFFIAYTAMALLRGFVDVVRDQWRRACARARSSPS
jgi:hypothetical protein